MNEKDFPEPKEMRFMNDKYEHTLEEYKEKKIVPTRLQYEDYYKNPATCVSGENVDFDIPPKEEYTIHCYDPEYYKLVPIDLFEQIKEHVRYTSMRNYDLVAKDIFEKLKKIEEEKEE